MVVVRIPLQIAPPQSIMAFGDDFKSDASEGDEKKRLADLLGFDRMLDIIKGGEGREESQWERDVTPVRACRGTDFSVSFGTVFF